MKKIILALSFISLLLVTILIANNTNELPKGWYAAGSNSSEYEMGVEATTFQNGNLSAFVKSKSPKENEFGTLMQTIGSANYLGKRVRLSSYIKSEDVKGWCGMWMRIDSETQTQLGFDNMQNRSIKGTTEWEKYEIVLDVPTNSKSINFGILLSGYGKVLTDNFTIEEVDESVEVTNMLQKTNLPKEPINLDFEK